jgi:nucleoside-diphosphate-sugar epimerase
MRLGREGDIVVIVVFGGTGMLGQHTAKELIDQGETVVVTGVRRQEPVLLKASGRQALPS